MRIISCLLVLLSLAVVISCEQGVQPNLDGEETFSLTSIEDRPDLLALISEFNTEPKSTENLIMNTGFGALHLDQIVERRVDARQAHPNYSIKLVPDQASPYSVEFLILEARQTSYYAYILQFESGQAKAATSSFLQNFSGAIRILDLERKVLSEGTFKDGHQTTHTEPNARVSDVYYDCDCRYILEPVYGPVTGGIIGYDTVLDCFCTESGGGGYGSPVGDPYAGGTSGGYGYPSGGTGEPGGTYNGGGSGSTTVGVTNMFAIESALNSAESRLAGLSYSNLQDKYRSRMTTAELQYFDKLSYSQRLNFLSNAYRAEETVKRLAPSYATLHNDKWDALRHAYLHGLTCHNVSVTVSTNMGNLHEDWVGNPPLEKQMDLFNNSVGRSTFYSVVRQYTNDHFYREGLLITLIQKMDSGGLKEIKRGNLLPTN